MQEFAALVHSLNYSKILKDINKGIWLGKLFDLYINNRDYLRRSYTAKILNSDIDKNFQNIFKISIEMAPNILRWRFAVFWSQKEGIYNFWHFENVFVFLHNPNDMKNRSVLPALGFIQKECPQHFFQILWLIGETIQVRNIDKILQNTFANSSRGKWSTKTLISRVTHSFEVPKINENEREREWNFQGLGGFTDIYVGRCFPSHCGFDSWT